MKTALRNLAGEAIGDGTPIVSTASEAVLFRHPLDVSRYSRADLRMALEAFGKYNSTSTPKMTFTLRLVATSGAAGSGTILCKTGLMTVGSSVTGAAWEVMARIALRLRGNPGSIYSRGKAVIFAGVDPAVGSATGAAAVSAMGSAGILVPTVVAPNLLQGSDLILCGTWDTSSASNSIQADDWSVEDIN